MDEIAGAICARVIMAGWMYAIEKTIVERRDLITRIGRRIQDDLDVPECLHIFTKQDPGIPADILRVTAVTLSLVYFFAFLVVVFRSPFAEPIWDPWVLGMGLCRRSRMHDWFILAHARACEEATIEGAEGRWL